MGARVPGGMVLGAVAGAFAYYLHMPSWACVPIGAAVYAGIQMVITNRWKDW